MQYIKDFFLSFMVIILPWKILFNIISLKWISSNSLAFKWRANWFANKGLHRIAAKILILIEISQNTKHGYNKDYLHQSLALVGVPRIGKTILSKRLSEHLGYPIVHMDNFQYVFEGMTNKSKKVILLWWIVDQMLESPIAPCIFEGLMIDTISKIISDDFVPYSIDNLAKRHHEGKICAFILGCTHSSVSSKYLAIEKYRNEHSCWTTKKVSKSEIYSLSRCIIKRSEELKQLAHKHQIVYIDISPDSFDNSINEALITILKKNRNYHKFL